MRPEHMQNTNMSLQQYKRERELWEKKERDKALRNQKITNVNQGYYNQVRDVTYGKSMSDALQEVRKNNHITHNQELMSFSGTAIHNGTIKPT